MSYFLFLLFVPLVPNKPQVVEIQDVQAIQVDDVEYFRLDTKQGRFHALNARLTLNGKPAQFWDIEKRLQDHFVEIVVIPGTRDVIEISVVSVFDCG